MCYCSPSAESEIALEITYDDYAKHLVDQNSFSIAVLATVLETNFQYHAVDDFRVRLPDIKFEVRARCESRVLLECVTKQLVMC